MNTILKTLILGVSLLGAAQANAEPKPVRMGPGGSAGVLCSTSFIKGKREAAQDPSKNASFSSDRTSVTVNCQYSDPNQNISRGPFICQSNSGAPVEIIVGPFGNDRGDWTGHVRCSEKQSQKQ